MSATARLLRPSSQFTPKSISGLALWLDASDASTLYQNSDGTTPATTAGDPVGYWQDKSGNGRNATQSTAANRPTIGTIASARGLVFDSTDSLLSTASMSDLIGSAASSPAMTIAFIATNASGAAGFSLGSDNATNGRLFVSNSFDGAGTSYFDVAGTAGGRLSYSLPSSSQTAASVYVLQRSGSSMIVRRNAATIASKSDASQTFSATSARLSIGQAIGLAGFSGTCGSVLCYPSALTASQYQRLERFLATRWNITLAPQVSDPDAQDWINRVYAAGSTVSQSAAAAVNTFVVGCKDDGIWTAMRKVLLLIGVDTFAGCAAHLKGTAPTFTNFSSANYSRTAGLQGVNTGYIRAAMRVSDLTASNSMHIAAWQTAANTAVATTFLAIGQGGGGHLRDNVTNTGIRANSVEVLTINSRGNAGTMIGMSRNSTTQYGIVNGTVTSGASTVNDTGRTNEYELMGSGTGSSYLGRVSFFSFGDGIDLATLNARVSTLMSTLGSL